MALRDTASDAMRKGAPGTHSITTRDIQTPVDCPPSKGHWLMAYSGTRGQTAGQLDSDFGDAGNGVGNDNDGDWDDSYCGI